MTNSPANQGTPSVTEELKPCPFCGSDAASFEHGGEGPDGCPCTVFCDVCHASAATEYSCEQAAANWNTRTDQPPQHTGLTDVERVVGNVLSLNLCSLVAATEEGRGKLAVETVAKRVAAAIAAAQQPVRADVERLLREARPYVEQAGLRHHDVSGLLAEIDAVLLVSNRSNHNG